MRKKNVIRLWLPILLMMVLLIQPVSVKANGEPDIKVNPTAIDFGTIVEVYSSSQPETVTITNDGTAELTIGTITISGPDAAKFHKQSDNCSEQVLALGNSADLEVVFRPDTTLPCSATLSIPSNDLDESLFNIPLSGQASASSYTDKPICTEDGDQQNPAIYWDRIVWEDNRTYTPQIHMYDLTADEETEVYSASGSQKNPAIWGDRIVWQDNRDGNYDIYMYDLATGVETPICTEESKQEEPAIWGDRIVWMDYRNGNRDIYMYDLATGETPICIEVSNQWHPAIWGDRIVWEDDRNTCLADGNADIYMYDLGTSGLTQITTDLRDQGNPAICGDRIVWEDDRNGNRDIYMYDLAGGELTAVCTEIHTQDNPAVSGEAIVWEDSRGAEEDIYLYELATGAEIPLCTAPNQQLTPAISGHRVVWEDLRDAPSWSGDGDIYSSAWVRPAGADLSISMTELTDPIEAGYYLTYVLNVTNYGPGSASGVEVTDSLPAGVELISATTSQGVCTHVGDFVTGDIGSIPAGATVTLNIVVRPDSAGVVTNEATVGADEADDLDYNNTATVSTRVSEYGIVRAAGRWGTCIATIGSTPVYYSYRLGAWHPSLAADPDGEVHLSYTREGWGIDHIANDVYVYGFDDIYYTSTDSAWFQKQQIYQGYGITNTAVIGGSWSRWEGKWSVMATDDAGNLHIAYVKHDSTGSAYEPVIDSYYYLKYVNNVGGTWNQSETVAEFIEVEDGSYGGMGGFWDLSLALDSSGSAHITYIDAERGPCNAPLIYVNNQSGNWVSQTLTQGYRANQSAAMALDSSNHLHIAFYSSNYDMQQQGLYYLTNAPAGAWQTPEYVDITWSGGDIEGMYTDIAVDDDDNPHISYVSGGGEDRLDTYYATKAGEVWSCTEVDIGELMSACNSIAVDSSGEAHIAYYHLPTDELRYATSANGWQPETIDDEIPLEWGEYFWWNDIAVDSQDRVNIVYSKNDFIYHATRGTPAGEDVDHDGAVNEEEQGPDGLNPAYDGNSDSTADYEQGHAVSLHTADGTYYVTVVSPDGTLLSNFQTMVNPSPGEAPAGAGFPFGFFDFMVYGLEPGAATTVDIYLPPGSNVESYYKYGATSDNLSPHWYEFLYDGETGAEINGNVVTLHLVDGGRGDGDVTANGVIGETGGPSSGSANTPPTAPEVDVTPDSPFTDDDILCTVTTPSTDNDGDDVTYTYNWYKDNILQSGETTTTTGLTDTLSSTLTAVGDTWKCVVTPNDGITDGTSAQDQVIIGNTPPTAPVVDVTPDLPLNDDDLVCTVTTESTDTDGDTVTYTYEWYKDGVLQSGETTTTTGLTDTLSSALTAVGDTWKGVVTPNDGITDGTSAQDQVIIVVTSMTETITDDGTLDATAEADTEVVVTGSANVTVAEYADNPGTGFSGDIGKHIDVHIDDATGISEIEIRLYYTDDEISGKVESSLKLQWWNGSAWAECSDTGVSPDTVNGYSGYIWARIRGNTTPTLDDLIGTPFGAAAPAQSSTTTGGGGGGGGGGAGITPVRPYMRDGEFTEDVIARSEDMKVEIHIHEGTVAKNVMGASLSSIRIQEMAELPLRPKDTSTVALVYEVGPAGATFNPAVDMIMEYDESKIPDGVAEKTLVLSTYDDTTGKWVDLESIVDTDNDTVTAKVRHFSAFTVLAYTRPASFTVTDLSVNPDEVSLGESVSISVLVTNTGDLTDNFEVNLQIDNVVAQTKEITLDGGDSEIVSFSVTPDTAGEYTVNIIDLLGIFEVKVPETTSGPVVEPAPASFTISDLTIAPSEVQPTEQVTITAMVTNTGDREGNYTVVLKVNGAEEARKEVAVGVSKSETVTFTVVKDVEGSYSVDIDGNVVQFIVTALTPPTVTPVTAPAPEAAVNWWPIGGIIACCLVVGLLVYFLVYRKRHASRLG